ncbi:MAG: efflux RND transporter periplasmic adaptor subunit, partial [Chloroflexi bacterium]|nr:efflux RND transporter periplasmic adaptor subunit [Chloroflexota bacterium]
MVYLPTQIKPVTDIPLPVQNTPTATVYQGDLALYARGSGTLVSLNEIKLGFGTSGPIAEINVQAGDKVRTGDVLAVQGDRERLEAAVAANQLAVMNAKQALSDLYAQALIDYENAPFVSAQAQLDLANAKAALHTAENKWSGQQEGNRASASTVAAAEAKLVLAQNELDKARTAYNKVAGRPPGDSERSLAQIDLSAAQQNYDTVSRQLNWYTGQTTEILQAQLDAEVAMAEERVAQIGRKLEKANAVGPDPDPDKITMAELQLASAEAELAVSRRNLEDATIAAPIDGTVLAVTEMVGHDVSGPFITLADLSQLYLEIFLDGTDIDKINLDYNVEVVFDALPNQIFTGQVVQIDPSLQTTGAVTLVKGRVKLDESSTTVVNLLIGMTATVNVIGGRAEGVLLIPIEALHEQSPGKYVVYIMENGVQVLRPVEVGLMDFSYAEIKSGLKVGESVVTGPVVGAPSP